MDFLPHTKFCVRFLHIQTKKQKQKNQYHDYRGVPLMKPASCQAVANRDCTTSNSVCSASTYEATRMCSVYESWLSTRSSGTFAFPISYSCPVMRSEPLWICRSVPACRARSSDIGVDHMVPIGGRLGNPRQAATAELHSALPKCNNPMVRFDFALPLTNSGLSSELSLAAQCIWFQAITVDFSLPCIERSFGLLGNRYSIT